MVSQENNFYLTIEMTIKLDLYMVSHQGLSLTVLCLIILVNMNVFIKTTLWLQTRNIFKLLALFLTFSTTPQL